MDTPTPQKQEARRGRPAHNEQALHASDLTLDIQADIRDLAAKCHEAFAKLVRYQQWLGAGKYPVRCAI